MDRNRVVTCVWSRFRARRLQVGRHPRDNPLILKFYYRFCYSGYGAVRGRKVRREWLAYWVDWATDKHMVLASRCRDAAWGDDLCW